MGSGMRIMVMSDIHGNKAAFQAVLERSAKIGNIGACILLGDLIDYGMHSNEVIQMAKALPYPVICNIRGNHEEAIIREEYDRFSSERGKACAKYTRSVLNRESWDYLLGEMAGRGRKAFAYGGKKCLAIHGSQGDEYWKRIGPEESPEPYQGYDYVFSGHSHLPHFMEKYLPAQDGKRRNKQKVIFINPGSVGQPRNLNPSAQFVILDMEKERVVFEKAAYDIGAEQSSYHGQVDDFYRERLEWGV